MQVLPNLGLSAALIQSQGEHATDVLCCGWEFRTLTVVTLELHLPDFSLRSPM